MNTDNYKYKELNPSEVEMLKQVIKDNKSHLLEFKDQIHTDARKVLAKRFAQDVLAALLRGEWNQRDKQAEAHIIASQELGS